MIREYGYMGLELARFCRRNPVASLLSNSGLNNRRKLSIAPHVEQHTTELYVINRLRAIDMGW
jgi:hypothetical protein